MTKTISLRIPKNLYDKLREIVRNRRVQAYRDNQDVSISLSTIIRDEMFIPFIENELELEK